MEGTALELDWLESAAVIQNEKPQARTHKFGTTVLAMIGFCESASHFFENYLFLYSVSLHFRLLISYEIGATE
jgi:hypothetical protein